MYVQISDVEGPEEVEIEGDRFEKDRAEVEKECSDDESGDPIRFSLLEERAEAQEPSLDRKKDVAAKREISPKGTADFVDIVAFSFEEKPKKEVSRNEERYGKEQDLREIVEQKERCVEERKKMIGRDKKFAEYLHSADKICPFLRKCLDEIFRERRDGTSELGIFEEIDEIKRNGYTEIPYRFPCAEEHVGEEESADEGDDKEQEYGSDMMNCLASEF